MPMQRYRYLLIAAIAIIGLVLAWFYTPPKEDVITPDPTNIEQQVPIDEVAMIDSYIRTNIASIATDKPVLGGQWYVVSIDVDTTANTAVVVYEDGHIQSGAVMSYIITNDQVSSVTVTSTLND